MKNHFKKLAAALLTAVTALSAPVLTRAEENGISTMTAAEITADMGVGWVLGNSLDCYGGGSDPSTAETYWNNPITTKSMIDTVKAAGFNTLRVPVTWYEKCDSDGNINKDWLARVKEVVDYGINNEMYVIINLHHEEGSGGRSGWLIPDNDHKTECEARLKSMWTQIATYFAEYDRHLIFEVMNEPRIVGGTNEWTGGTDEVRSVINDYNAAAVEAIRATGGINKTRLVMCPGCAAKIDSLKKGDFEVPDDDNVAVSVHNYSPYEFAMNQTGTAEWGSDSDKQALTDEVLWLYNNYVAKGIPVVLGEIGATYKYESDANRPEWAKYYVATAKKYGIPCCVWDNNEIDKTSENFGLLNRSSLTWYFTDLVQAFIEGADGTFTLPETSTSSNYGKVIFSGSSTATDYDQPYKEDIKNLPDIVEGCTIAVEYTATNPPYLVFQNYTNEDWNKVSPDSVSDGVAYYSYDSIISACEGEFANQQQMLIQCNSCSTTVTKITIIYPASGGDVNLDNEVTKTDAALILHGIIGSITIDATQKISADINNDGEINMLDVIAILGKN